MNCFKHQFVVSLVVALVSITFLYLIWMLTWHGYDTEATLSEISWRSWLISSGFVFGFVSLLYYIGALNEVESTDDRSAVLYGRYLILQGYVLLILGIGSSIALTGLIVNEIIAFPGTSKPGVELDVSKAAYMLPVSFLLAAVGSVFFNANAMYEKKRDEREFDSKSFWAGFWFRMGESVLFALVIFLLCVVTERGREYFVWLPVFSLLMGMFVKSGEVIVSGAAMTLFSAFERLFQPLHEQRNPRLPADTATDRLRQIVNDEVVVGGGNGGQQRIAVAVDADDGKKPEDG